MEVMVRHLFVVFLGLNVLLGTYYDGETVDGVKQGSGVMRYPDRSEYKGHWQDDKRNGFGTHRLADGTTYNGEWENDMRHGNKEMV